MPAADPWAVVSQTPVPPSPTSDSATAADDPWAVVAQTPVVPEKKSVTGFLGNVVGSGYSLGKNLVNTAVGAVEKPLRTGVNYATGSNTPPSQEEQQFDNIGDVIAGLTHQGFKKVGLGSTADETPEAQSDIAKAQAMEGQYKQRYGGLKNIGETLYNDPVGVLADAATVTGGVAGASGKMAELADAAKMGRTANTLRTVSKGATAATVNNPIVSVPSKYAPAAYKATKTTIGNFRDSVADPHVTMIQALRPTASRTGWDKSIATAMPDIKAAEATTGPISDVDSLLAAVQQAKRIKRGQLQMYTTPAQQAGMVVDMAPVADAMEKAIPETVKFENTDVAGRPSGAYKAALDQAALYRRTVPIERAEQFLQDANAALDGYYAKYPGVRRAQLRSNPETAALVKKADALRDVFYEGLDNTSSGAMPRDINRRYGALTDIEDAALRRKNVAARLAPQNLVEQIGNLATAKQFVKAGLNTVAGNPLAAVGDLAEGAAVRAVAKWMKEHQNTNNLIRRAFKNYSNSPKQFPGPGMPPAPPIYPALPPSSSPIGVSGVTVPNFAGQIRTGTNRMMAGPRQIPAGTSPIGVSGTLVPDIIGSSSRGQGTRLPLIEAPPPGGPSAGVSQPPTQGTGGFRKRMKPSEVSGPGAKTVGQSTPYQMPAAGTFKNPYRE